MKKQLLSLFLVFAVLSINAQSTDIPNGHRCSTTEHMNELFKQNPEWKKSLETKDAEMLNAQSDRSVNASAAIITIPVVVHVLWKTTDQNIPDAKILAQIAQLNLDFAGKNPDTSLIPTPFKSLKANTQIQFCLAKRDPNGAATTGIKRIQTSVTSFSTNDAIKSTSSGGSTAWPVSKYLNLWVGNLSSGLLGYAQFPGGPAATDGVVVSYKTVGSVANPASFSWPFNYGRSATHEIGHWLSLYHIWGDENNCTGSDQVTDTPNQTSPNSACPSYPRIDACSPSSPGVMFMNYMDYVDDACMVMFSSGQKTRITSTMNGSRSALKTSLGCSAVTGIADYSYTIGNTLVYPNPSNGKYTIDLGEIINKVDLTVTDVYGRLVEKKNISSTQLFDIEINQAAGIYFIHLMYDDKKDIVKVIKQ